MTNMVLKPSLDLLKKEYVLIQAWKKTSKYIRYHNWYADTLALDWATVNLPNFIAEVAESIETTGKWENHPLRIVPAPKKQQWCVSKTGTWEPIEQEQDDVPLRPLAHVNLRDQVIATALMLCLADRVETRQGDPRIQYKDAEFRKKVSSYGNRLFCDKTNGELRHRWGSANLYRSYYEDYQSFISRPTTVAESIRPKDGQRIFVVESDLSKFYDRVCPERLMDALRSLQNDDDEQGFFDLAERVLNWRWDSDDHENIAPFVKQLQPDDFTRVALPQGLVSAGFFANVVLLAFDKRLRSNFGKEIVPGICLEDACRYVDDLRVVVTTDLDVPECKTAIVDWLQILLDDEATGLQVSKKKTEAVEFGGSQRPIVRHSARMRRIQSAVSGGFDAVEGEAILDTIQGLVRSQQELSRAQVDSGWGFASKSDVREETVARFAANRFRKTYRSIRPLFEVPLITSAPEESTSESEHVDSLESRRNRQELDEDAKEFARRLVTRWVEDPSNVRLLRIGLDIWPDPEILQEIFRLLKPFIVKGRQSKELKQVAWYCLAEILRAGATETGIVDDEECLPANADLKRYREILCNEAARLVSPSAGSIPWYLRQQAFLFLASFAPSAAPIVRIGQIAETREYRRLILFLRGEISRLSSSEFATLAVIARRAVLDAKKSADLVRWGLTADHKNEIAARDPSFALELNEIDADFEEGLLARVKEDLCFETSVSNGDLRSLAEIVLRGGPENPLRNELSLLRFAAKFLKKLQLPENSEIEIITPGQVRLKLKTECNIAKVSKVKISESQTPLNGSLYAPPTWCESNERWRFQLGFLLRFILTGHPDFTNFVRPEYLKEGHASYRHVRSHWFQRIYGLYNGQPAFGDDWLPISDWAERFLLALLSWPGCRTPTDFEWVEHGIGKAQVEIKKRIKCLEEKQGAATKTLMMPMISEWPTEDTQIRSLRGCVLQTVVPEGKDFDKCDITLSQPEIRRKHRNHLSAALESIKKMIDLRRTHEENDGRLDWLILPELAVHPHDVKTHLIPFARKYKTMILAGLTYEELLHDKPPINSALWIMPKQPNGQGLQIQTRRQGKFHIAPDEKQFGPYSFRPCQWLIGYPWSETQPRPLWLSASICYDATDIKLAADLREKSDIYAIPALNKDVSTFDQMALALNYHMFQYVVVVNNGRYGGSSAYWPVEKDYKRQIFHLHGQPQASIAFFEIEDISFVLGRLNHIRRGDSTEDSPKWKSPPAGLK